jgi:hypothetical protein
MSGGYPRSTGLTLTQWLATCGADQSLVPKVFDNLIATVARLHSRNEVHGALTPDAVIIDADGQVRLMPAVADRTRTVAAAWRELPDGTFALFAAPEQLRARRPTRATDLFCLGLLLHMTATGRHPFAAPSRGEAMAALLFHAPRGASPLVAKLLAKQPDDRRVDTVTSGRDVQPAHVQRPQGGQSVKGGGPAPVGPSHGGFAAMVKGQVRERTPSLAPRRLFPVSTTTLILSLFTATFVAATTTFFLHRWKTHQLSSEISSLEAMIKSGQDLKKISHSLAAAKSHYGDLPIFDRLRGDAACAKHKPLPCAQAYGAALRKQPSLRSDPELAVNLLQLLDQPVRKSELAGITSTLKELGIGRVASSLVERTRATSQTVRWNAVHALETLGEAAKIDYVSVYSLELQHGATCERRRYAVEKLTALGDPRALEHLRAEERHVRESLLERFCMGRAAAEGVAALSGRAEKRPDKAVLY